MKRMVLTGALATALIVGGGTSVYMAYAKESTPSPTLIGQQQGGNVRQMITQTKSGDFEDMQQFMENGNVNFGQMKPYMKQMHPDLSDQQLEELYKEMHGKGGACNSTGNTKSNTNTNSQNSQGMMGNNL